MQLSARKPGKSPYPKELKTVGDHIRKRRLDLDLLQRDVARRIGVTPETAWQWETNRTEPATRHLPAIVDFLGYVPGGAGRSFPEALRRARRAVGLSQEQLADRAYVDESSVAKWERGETLPLPPTVQRLRRFFKSAGRPLPEFGPSAFYGPERRAEVARRGWHAKKSRVRVPGHR